MSGVRTGTCTRCSDGARIVLVLALLGGAGPAFADPGFELLTAEEFQQRKGRAQPDHARPGDAGRRTRIAPPG